MEKENFKSGFISLVGRTNVGKSTLINMLIGQKVAAVANKVQTTRYAIKAILNNENSQIIFIDTPGIHKPKTKLSKTMNQTSYDTLTDSDLVLFMVEGTSNGIGPGDQLVLDKIKESGKKAILLINKIDLIQKEKLLRLISLFSEQYDFCEIIPISANDDSYKQKIVESIEKHLPIGPAYYDKEEYTDQSIRQIAEEIVREKCLMLLHDEIPHGIYVTCQSVKEEKNINGKDILKIECEINCIRSSHKPIIIGKNGSILKKINTMSRYEMEKAFDIKVKLDLWVKVKKDWNEMDSIVNKFKLK